MFNVRDVKNSDGNVDTGIATGASQVNVNPLEAGLTAEQITQQVQTEMFKQSAKDTLVNTTNPLILQADNINKEETDTSFIDSVGDAITSGIPAVIASAVLSVSNTAVEFGNMLGGDFEKTDQVELLNDMGMYETAKYYEKHKDVIDVAGFIAGSIIPGMAGVKALRLLQSSSMVTNSSFRAISGFGRLSKSSQLVRDSVRSIATGSQKEVGIKLISSTLARGVGQNTLESVAGGIAMLATLNQSPFLNKDNLGYFDSVSANFWTTTKDAVLGGVVFGSIGGIWNVGKFKRAANEAMGIKTKITSEAVTDFNNQLTGGDNIVSLAERYNTTRIQIQELESQAIDGIITETGKNIELPGRKRNLKVFHSEILNQIKEMTPDTNLANAIQQSILNNPDEILTMPITMANLMRFQKVNKVADDSGIYNSFGHVSSKTRNAFNSSELLNNLVFAKVSEQFKYSPALVAEFENTLKITERMTVADIAKKVGTYSEKELNKLYEDLQLASIEYRPKYWEGIEDAELRFKNNYMPTTPKGIRAAHFSSKKLLEAYNPSTFFPDAMAAFDKKLLSYKKEPLLYRFINDTSLGNSIDSPNLVVDLLTGQTKAGNILPTASDIGEVSRGKMSKDFDYKIQYGERKLVGGAGKYNLDDMKDLADEKRNWYAVDKNAEFIAAKFLPNFPSVIKETDYPLLDAAFARGIKVNVEGIGELEGSALGEYIKGSKIETLRKIQTDMIGKPKAWNVDQLAKILNTDENFIAYTGVNSAQIPATKFTLTNLSIELPRYAKAVYKPLKDGEDVFDGLSDTSIVMLKQQAIDYKNKIAGKEIAGLYSDSLSNLFNQQGSIASVETLTEQAGQRFASYSNGDYKTLESMAQFIGSIVERVKQEVNHSLRTAYSSAQSQVMASTLAKAEIGLVINKARSANYLRVLDTESITNLETQFRNLGTPESLAAASKVGEILTQIKGTKGELGLFLREETSEALTASSQLFNLLSIKPPKNIDKLIEKSVANINNLTGNYKDCFRVANREVDEFLKVHQQINKKYISSRRILKNTEGKTLPWNQDRLYFHPPKVDNSFMAFVQSAENPVTNERIKSVIIGKDATELADKVKFIETNYPDYKIITPSEQKRFAEALADYQGDTFGYNREFDMELQSKGVMNTLNPRTDGLDMQHEIDSMINSHMQMLDKTVLTYYSDTLAPLKAIEQALDDELGLTTGSGKKYFANNPARKVKNLIIATPSDVSPVWDKINNTIQTSIDRSIGFLDDLIPRGKELTEQNIKDINELMTDLGYKHAYSTAAEHVLANTSIPKTYVRQFIGTVNSVISMMMLRMETMASIIDSIGTVTLMSPEIRSIINNIPREELGLMFGVSNGTKVPEFTVTRLMAKQLSKVMNNPSKPMVDKYREMGLLIKQNEYFESFHNAILLEDGMTLTKLQNKIRQIGDLGSKFSGSNSIRDFTRLWLANIGEELGRASGLKEGLELGSFINTFMNRVQGNITASQRPKVFQGVIGQAVGLFQSYMFNLMQQATRHIADGNSKRVLEILAINSTLFGMQSLPGWQSLNNVVAQQNREGFGLDTGIRSAAGDDIGNWLMYGTLSNVSQLGVFSRGQIGVGLIDPTTGFLEKLPAVSITRSVLENLGNTMTNLGNSGNKIDALLEAVSLNGLNRPAAELAQLALGYQPTRKGDVIDYTDTNVNNFKTWWSLFGAMLGAKNLDSAVIRQQYYTQYGREAALNAKLNPIMQEVKNDSRSGELTQERMEEIFRSYAAAGGDLGKFQKWLVNVLVNGQASQSRKLASKIASDENKINQSLMRSADDNLFAPDEDSNSES